MKNTCSKPITVRRSLLSLAVAALALSGGSVSAQTKTLYIGMNGGAMEKTWTEHIFPAFEKANNVKVVVVPEIVPRSVKLLPFNCHWQARGWPPVTLRLKTAVEPANAMTLVSGVTMTGGGITDRLKARLWPLASVPLVNHRVAG